MAKKVKGTLASVEAFGYHVVAQEKQQTEEYTQVEVVRCCSTCAFYVADTDDSGTCHREYPGNIGARWPMVAKDEWCGSWGQESTPGQKYGGEDGTHQTIFLFNEEGPGVNEGNPFGKF